MSTNDGMNSIKKTTTIEGDKLVNTSINTHRPAAGIVGGLFIIATVTAIIGLLLCGPILNNPDILVKGFENRNQVTWGTVMELMLVLSGIGTQLGCFQS
jgi:hypothetical protein